MFAEAFDDVRDLSDGLVQSDFKIFGPGGNTQSGTACVEDFGLLIRTWKRHILNIGLGTMAAIRAQR